MDKERGKNKLVNEKFNEGKAWPKNKILTITPHSIPYVKELRQLPLVRSISACLLMQQLDYWFVRYPAEFYKFLEPCEQRAYKEGDSWCEELGISADEFRTAFDQIGVRYESKKKYNEAKRAGDIFGGKYYCSYTDKISRLTYYYRNHDVVNKAIDGLLKEEVVATPILAQPVSRTREGQSLYLEKLNADYTKTTSKTTSKITNNKRGKGLSPSAQDPSVFDYQEQDSEIIYPKEDKHSPEKRGSSSAGNSSGGVCPATVGVPDPFGQVFDDWRAVMEKPDAFATTKRRAAVNARLRNGYTIEDIKLAIRGILFSKFHMGENGVKAVYDDIELICRNGENVEKYRDLAKQKGIKSDDKLRKSNFAKRTYSTTNAEGGGNAGFAKRI